MFNTKLFLIQSFWQAANERECIAGRGVGACKKPTFLSLCMCCHYLLNIQLWAWKLCDPKVSKVELCQLTLLHADRMWPKWSQNPDNWNCSSNLELGAVMAKSMPPPPHPPVNKQLNCGVKEVTRLPRICRGHERTVTRRSRRKSKFAFITYWYISIAVTISVHFVFCNNLLRICRFCIRYMLLVVTWNIHFISFLVAMGLQ